MTEITTEDRAFLVQAVAVAEAAEAAGNLPVGAILVLDGEVVAEGANALLVPTYVPGNHAEVMAVRAAPPAIWPRARDITCYTTLEPCTMCMGTLLLHGVGRVVYGAVDPEGGAGSVLAHLPRYYADGRGVPAWIGPGLTKACDPLYARTRERFQALPCAVMRA